MERTITAEERIRRAEEIYQRRKMRQDVKVPTANVNSREKSQYILFKKLLLQILICLVIYFIFYLIRNSNYIFSENVLTKTKEFLSYDINFQKVYTQTQEYYNNKIKPLFSMQEDENGEDINKENIENKEEVNEIQGGIGGGEDNTEIFKTNIAEVSSDEEINNENKELTQMEIDANDIKTKCSFILPLKGTITSRYGPRTPTEIVSANHAGIDIAANEGTVFIASMEGTVTMVTGEGGYGNHVYIKNDDVTTLYAHCKKIYVKEGEKIKQGQQIGEVGSTGNATGPHLHFEIRKEDRIVNPEYILLFE